MRKPRQQPRQRLSALRLVALLVLCCTFAMPPATAAGDVDPPTVEDFTFSPAVVDVGSGHQFVTVTAHLVDQTGASAPMVVVGTDGSPSSQQTLWFSMMTLKSGTIQDGVWETQAYIPPSTEVSWVAGSWPVWLDMVSDTAGNSAAPLRHPTELTVLDSSSEPSPPPGPVNPTPTAEPTPTPTGEPTPTAEPTPTPTAPVPTAVPLPTVPADAAAPGRTTKPRVAVRGRRAVVRWNKPATNGAPITMYLVDVSRGRDQLVASGRRASLRKLQPGRYRVRVAAVNAVGRAAFSRWVRFTIR